MEYGGGLQLKLPETEINFEDFSLAEALNLSLNEVLRLASMSEKERLYATRNC